MLEALSLEARTRGKDRRRKLSAFLSLSLSLSLHSSPLLSAHSWPPSSSLLSPYRLSNNAPLCSATLEPCIFLDAMDFPKAFRCFASTLYRLASPRRALFPTISRLRTFVPSMEPNRAASVVERFESTGGLDRNAASASASERSTIRRRK